MADIVKENPVNNWDDLIIPDLVRTRIDNTIESMPFKVFFYSGPGTGKTSTAHLMAKNTHVFACSGSNSFNTEFFNTVIQPFVLTPSPLYRYKTLIVDECEKIDKNLQKSFKDLSDKAIRCNIIFITNHPHDVIKEMYSRFTEFNYEFTGPELAQQKMNYASKLLDIMEKSKLVYDDDVLAYIIKKNFPDMRKAYNTITMLVNSEYNRKITVEDVKVGLSFGKRLPELYAIIENQKLSAKDLYFECSKYSTKEIDCMQALGEPYFQYLVEKQMYETVIASAEIIAKYSNWILNTVNKFPTFYACIQELRTLFR